MPAGKTAFNKKVNEKFKAVPPLERKYPDEADLDASKAPGRTYTDYRLPCPVEGCKFVSPRTQGLAAHVRSVHPQHYRKFGGKAAPAGRQTFPPLVPPSPPPTVKRETIVVPEMGLIEDVVEVPGDPLALLDQAIEGLTGKLVTINESIQKLQAMLDERSGIQTQLQALQHARHSFVPPTPAAGWDQQQALRARSAEVAAEIGESGGINPENQA